MDVDLALFLSGILLGFFGGAVVVDAIRRALKERSEEDDYPPMDLIFVDCANCQWKVMISAYEQ